MYRLYGALTMLAWAAIDAYRSVIDRHEPGKARAARRALRGHLADGAAPPAGGVWIHGASVGEVRLALAVVGALRRRAPCLPICLTSGTATGRALAAEGAGAGVRPDLVAPLPIDTTAAMERFLDGVRPRLLLLLETEIWPNLLRACARRGLPVVLLNGRVSPRAFRRYRWARPWLAGPLQAIGAFGVQSEAEARRLRALGAPPGRVRITGNLKYDLPAPALGAAEARRLIGVPEGVPLFIAGSTAAGEDEPAIAALAALRAVNPRTRLVSAPRHPERFGEAEAALRRAGLTVARFSALEAGGTAGPPGAWDALLIDAVGVLPRLYPAADVAFVGGSFVRRGGQNLIEPAAVGVPVVFGLHVENFQAAADLLVAAGGGFMVRDGHELAEVAARLLADPAARAAAGAAARGVAASQRGALERSLAIVDEFLAAAPPSSASGRAAAGDRVA